MRAVGRRAGLLAVAAALLVGVAQAPAGAQTEGGDAAADTTATLETVASCLSASESLLVAFVMDESASLVDTDPDNRRVEAARLALRNFADLANGGDNSPEIEAYVGAFARNFTTAADWGDVSDTAEFTRIDTALQGFATRNQAIDTDIPTALARAREQLADRAADVSGSEPCKVVLLFTDGEYSLNDGPLAGPDSTPVYAPDLDLTQPGTAAQAMQLGRAFLCDEGGVADDLRNDGVVVLTAALTSAIADEDQDFLRAISTGRGGDVTCGSDSDPAYGAFLAAGDVGELVAIFNRIGTETGGGTVVHPPDEALPVCVGGPCAEGRNSFVLDSALARFTALAQIGASGIDAVVTDPAGMSVTASNADDGTGQVGPVDLEWEWVDDTTVRFTGDLPARERDEWTGDWGLTFVAPDSATAAASRPEASFGYFTDWEPVLVGDPEMARGQETELVVEVRDRAGNLVDPAATGSEIALVANVTDPASDAAGDVSVEGDGSRFRVLATAPESGSGGSTDLEAALVVTTESGLELVPQTRVFSIPTRVAALYPTVGPSDLRLGAIRGTGTTSAELIVQAAADADGCVWFESEPVAGPSGSEITASFEGDPTSRADCLAVGAGERVTVEVTFANSETAEGTARGTITAMLASGAGGGVENLSVGYSFELAPPINEAARWGLFAAILLPGILAPIGVLVLVNRRLARYRVADDLVAARVKLLVERTVSTVLRVYAEGDSSGDVVVRENDDGSISNTSLITVADFRPLMPRRHGLGIEVADVHLVVNNPKNPFAEPSGMVDPDREPVAARVLGDVSADEKRLPLAASGTWMVRRRAGQSLEVTVHDTNRSAERLWLRVELIALLTAQDMESQVTALTADLRARVAAAANALADGLPSGLGSREPPADSYV